MTNKLESLKTMTIVVADTGDINQIKKYKPHDATTNPALILSAYNLDEYKDLIIDAITYAKSLPITKEEQLVEASDKLIVNIGVEILKHIPGRVSTEVDARLSYDTEKTIIKARKLINLYKNAGIDKSRVLIKIAATWQGIKAAEILEKEGINCNLTLLFSFAQAVACAQANVYLISPFVGRIYDWYKTNGDKKEFLPDEDPGVVSVKNIYKFYKEHKYNTIIMGASFRNISQIEELAGCDRLTIAPGLLEELANNTQPILQKLHIPSIFKEDNYKLDESNFYLQHNSNKMAVDKLIEGIIKFSEDQNSLDSKLLARF